MSGLTDKEVAEQMGIATDTVRNYWKRIRSKVGGSSRAEIIATMVRHGMIQQIEAKQSENEQLMSEIAKRRVAEQERHRLLIELEQEKSWLQAVLQQMPCGLTITEAPSGRLIQWNPKFEEMVGPVPPDPVGADGLVRLDWRDPIGNPMSAARTPYRRALEHGEVVDGEELELTTAVGEVRRISLSSGPIRDRAGTIVAVITIWRRLA